MNQVAVIIPLHNKAETVASTIGSVKAQRLEDFECVIIDDGSTDDGAAVVAEAIADDDRFRYIYQENAGVANARNAGVFKHTTAPFIMCLDSDDQIGPGYLSGLLPSLEENRVLGIVYTKLVTVMPGGETRLSQWPHKFDAVAQFGGGNQIPTSALTTRTMWDRLGGQRQRFAPGGAGAEDGEFWLRASSRGFGALFVPLQDDGWFYYRAYQGLVSGNKNYIPPDYKVWSPWTTDKSLMPGPSVFPADLHSHGVRWYDKPQIAVVIPVAGPHIWELDNALDSLDAQTYRNFETVVVFDADKETWARAEADGRLRYIAKTWPDCRFTSVAARGKLARSYTSTLEADLAGSHILRDLPTGPRGGPAKARNIGMGVSSAPLLFFLDADDWLVPETLREMLERHLKTGKIIYSDHIGIAAVDQERLQDVTSGSVEAYDAKRGSAFIDQKVADYDCKRAMRQPVLDGTPPYIICNVSALVPRRSIEAVGGFDESVISWEDVLMFWRIAWTGMCFERIPKPLLVYRYRTGRMRQIGMENARDLLLYAAELSKRYEKMGCGCSEGPVQPKMEASMGNGTAQLKLSRGAPLSVADSELVLVLFEPRNRGTQLRYGQHDFGGGNRVSYGPKSGGEKFLVHKNDLASEESLARVQGRTPEFIRLEGPSVGSVKEEPKELDAPVPVVEASMAAPFSTEPLDVWITEDEDELETALPERLPGGPTTLLNTLDYGELKSTDRYLAILASSGITTVGELIDFEEEHGDNGGIATIRRIGPKAREAFVSAARGEM